MSEIRLTPRITRPPATLKVYDKIRVAGRVHALVRFRPSLAPPHNPPRRGRLSTHAMPHATSDSRGHARHDGRRRFDHAAAPLASAAHPICKEFISQQESNARHQRRARAIDDKRPADLRVRCMPLLGCVLACVITPFHQNMAPGSLVLAETEPPI